MKEECNLKHNWPFCNRPFLKMSFPHFEMGSPYFEMEFSIRFPYSVMLLSALFPHILAFFLNESFELPHSWYWFPHSLYGTRCISNAGKPISNSRKLEIENIMKSQKSQKSQKYAEIMRKVPFQNKKI